MKHKMWRKITSLVLCLAMILSMNMQAIALDIEDIELTPKASVVKSNAQVQDVIDKIEAVGTVEYTDDCLSKIVTAEKAYAALSSFQKEQVDNYILLVTARNGYNAIAADRVDTSGYTIIDNGIINSTVKWYVYDNGVLEISGTGSVPSYSANAPWRNYVSSINSIIVRSSITAIGSRTFSGCNKVTSITLPFVGASRTAVGYEAHLGYIFGYSTIVGSGGSAIATGYKVGDVYSVSGNEVQYVTEVSGNYTYFSKYYIFSVPSALKTVTITDATDIRDAAFFYCESITQITLNDDVSSIGAYAFYNCSLLKDYVIPNQVGAIGEYAFYNDTALTEIYIPDAVTKIEPYTFYGCNKISRLVISKNVTSIGDSAFLNNSELTNLIIPESTTTIGSYAFARCNKLTTIVIPDKVTSLGTYVFSGDNNVTSLSIGAGVETIPSYAFANCTGLTTIIVPDTVVTINEFAFSGCNKVTSITLPFVGASRTAVGYEAHLGYIFGYSTIVGSGGSAIATGYKVGDVYSVSGNEVQYVTEVSGNYTYFSKYYIFSVPSALKTVTITDATDIRDAAFFYCESITQITLNDDVSSIGAYVFVRVPWYSNLNEEFNVVGNGVLIKYSGTRSSITFPETVKYIGGSSFGNNTTINTTISQVSISDKITGIGGRAFNGIRNLTSLTIPKTVSSIGSQAIPSTCTISVYQPSAGYDYRSTNRIVLNNSFTTGQDTFYYVVNDNDFVEIIGTETTSTEITVPEEIDGKVVDRIGDYGFAGCTTLNSITIPANIKFIGKNAFEGCTGLINATIPTTVDSVGDYAFKNCTNLTYVTISEGVKSIGKGCFYNCTSLVEAVVPDTVETLGSYAFYSCSEMTTATIGIKADAIKEYTFYNCTNLNTIVIGISVEEIGDYAFYNCALNRVTVPSTVITIGNYAFANNSVMTRATLRKNLLTIGDGAFQNCEALATMSLPTTVTSIGRFAFENCTSLPSVTIPAGVTVLNDFVFSNCSSLANVTFNSNATRIGESAFYNNAFVSIALPETVESIDKSAFRHCVNLTAIHIPDATKLIGDSAFLDCTELTNVSLPDDVQNVGSSVFVNNNDLTAEIRYLTGTVANSLLEKQGVCHVVLDENITMVGDLVFAYCYDLQDITYGENAVNAGEFLFSANITGLGSEVFKDVTLLKNLIIPDTIQTIGDNAFYNYIVSGYNTSEVTVTFYCVNGEIAESILYDQKIAHIYVEDNIVSIGDNAFGSCTILETASLPDTISECGNNVFANSSGNVRLDVRCVDGVVDANTYKSKTDGITCIYIDENIITIGESAFEDLSTVLYVISNAQNIGNRAFANSMALKWLQLYFTETIGDYSFYNCISMEDVYIDSDLVHIGEHAFEECKLIPEVVLPETVRDIGAYAFYNCNSMAHINVPYGVPAINSHTFFGCASLLQVNLPDTVERIEDYAYYGCVLVNDLTLGNSVTFIGEYAFYNCNQVVEIILPETVEIIEDYAFRGCSSLQKIKLPDSVTSLGDCVFYACVGLEEAEFGSGITSIGDRVFYACVKLIKLVLYGDVDYIHDLAFYGADDTTVYAYDNEYVEEYCEEQGLVYVNLSGEFEMVLTPPNRLEYVQNEELDLTGLKLVLTYANGTTRTVTSGYIVEGYDSTMIGTQTVTVTYKGHSATFEVSVTAIGHVYRAPEWIWSSDKLSAQAVFRCVDCDHIETVNATVATERIEPTYDADGSITYTATALFEGTEYIDTITVVLPKLIPEKQITISCNRDYTVSIDGVEDYFAAEITMPVAFDAHVVVTVDDTTNFAYWRNSANMIVSRTPVLDFYVTVVETYTAVYNTNPRNKVTVIFESLFDQIMGRYQLTVAGIDSLTMPAVPSRYGYTIVGWEYDNAALRALAEERLATSDTSDDVIIVKPVYIKNAETRTITVNGGSGSGEYNEEDVLTVVANQPATGMKFSHWEDADGTVLSYRPDYTFYVMKDMILTAVFVSEGTEVVPTGVATIIKVVRDYDNRKISFASYANVPDGFVIKNAGVIATSNATVGTNPDGFDISTASFVRGTDDSGTAMRFIWTKSNVGTETWYARAFITYTDTNGNTLTVYGDIVSANLNE